MSAKITTKKKNCGLKAERPNSCVDTDNNSYNINIYFSTVTFKKVTRRFT